MTDENTRREFMGKTGATAGLGVLGAAMGAGTAGAQTMEINAMGPTPEQMQAFMALPSDKPVVMVNLLKFKDAAAYARYGVEVRKILSTIGAEMIFSGRCEMALIGGVQWDAVGMVRYPNAQALVKMGQSPEYQAIHHHRADGLEGQINLAVFES